MLPPHFMRATYPKIGARIIYAGSDSYHYWGLLLPGHEERNTDWILRSYWVHASSDDKKALMPHLKSSFVQGGLTNIRWYEYADKSIEQFAGKTLRTTKDGLIYEEPGYGQAMQAQDLQRRVWNVSDPAFLYPYDLYHPESGLACKLVVTDNEKVVGFLFGFYGRGRQWYGSKKGFQDGQWQESQLMGIENNYRRKGIARNLKLIQREIALEEGLEIIHWTVDPLQASNARLNLNSLGGVAVQHYRDYYAFRNNLNWVAASRIGISWVINSPRVIACVRNEREDVDYKTIIADSGTETVTPVIINSTGIHAFKTDGWLPEARTILFEIPADWNAVQQDNVVVAEAWRKTSDHMFARILQKNNNDGYAITGIVKHLSEERFFLVIQKITDNLGI
ncbi:hypothetical protein D4S03_05245 [bacterium]|nr:MAG: hypothetical protein D4S03_05245 [bacterium]